MPHSIQLRSVPKYSMHKASGRAYARFNGRCIYFGRYGTAASREAFNRLTAAWLRNGGSLPAEPEGATFTEVDIADVEFATDHYRKDGKPTDELRMIKSALRVARESYGHAPASEFGPLALQLVCDAMIAKGWCRTHINRQVDRIKRMFKWAARQQMIPGDLYQALRCVDGLKRGVRKHEKGAKYCLFQTLM